MPTWHEVYIYHFEVYPEMKNIEIIEIRAFSSKKNQLDEHIKYFYTRFRKEAQRSDVYIFKRMDVNTDYLIIISSTLENTDQAGLIAKRLEDALKDFGLINHTTWIEI